MTTRQEYLVLTRQVDFREDGCITMYSLEGAINYAIDNKETELFIIGGGQIYKEALEKDLIDKMYITHVHHQFEGDTFFPSIDNTIWKKVSETKHPADEKHQYAYSFVVYEKMT